MRALWNLALFCILAGAPLWTQSGSTPPRNSNSDPQAPQPPPQVSDSRQKSSTDQASPANAGDSTKLEAIKTSKAIYPYEAREQKLQGEVIVKILVSETGDVETAEAVSGDPIFGKAAMDAVRKWKFKPFIKDGKPVKVSTKLPFDFAFNDKIMENGVSADRTTTTDTKTPKSPVLASSGPTGSSADASGSPPNRVRVSSGVSRGLLIRQVAPVYPDEARRARIQGTVILAAVISKEGRIADLRLISGPKELAQAAIGAVQQWKYQPYMLLGNPVEVETQIQVNFTLR
jgi:TonB family protein